MRSSHLPGGMERIIWRISYVLLKFSGCCHLLLCVFLSYNFTRVFASAFSLSFTYLANKEIYRHEMYWRILWFFCFLSLSLSLSLSHTLSTLCIPTSTISCCWSDAFWKPLMLTAICQKASRCIYTPMALYQNSRVPAGIKLLLYMLFV